MSILFHGFSRIRIERNNMLLYKQYYMNTGKKTTPTILLSPDLIRRALSLPGFDAASAHSSMSPSPRPLTRPSDKPGHPRIGAVLLVLYKKFSSPHILLIRRHEDLKYHPGQISFPGGRQESGEELIDTALRETREEVGLQRDSLQVLGTLEPVYISPSDFIVHPFVAWHDGAPVLKKEESEVAAIIETPLDLFLDPSIGGTEIRLMNNRELTVPFYRLGEHTVWGATAMILSELLQRLSASGVLIKK
jgi:8-oxo-dGTP pyrophosphatase MutT (NUDIX family)